MKNLKICKWNLTSLLFLPRLCADYTRGLSREALIMLFKYLPAAYANGSKDLVAREKVHSAATIAGMAFGNAFLGICHSMAHKLGAELHIPHGLANAGECWYSSIVYLIPWQGAVDCLTATLASNLMSPYLCTFFHLSSDLARDPLQRYRRTIQAVCIPSGEDEDPGLPFIIYRQIKII